MEISLAFENPTKETPAMAPADRIGGLVLTDTTRQVLGEADGWNRKFTILNGTFPVKALMIKM